MPCWAGAWRQGPSQSFGETATQQCRHVSTRQKGLPSTDFVLVLLECLLCMALHASPAVQYPCLARTYHPAVASPAWARRSWACSSLSTCRYRGPLAGWRGRRCTLTQVGAGRAASH